MKARSVKYLTAEGFKNIWINRMMSIASVGVLMSCMLLMGVAYAVSYNINQIMYQVQDQDVAMVYIDTTYTTQQSQEVATEIKAVDNVKSTTFIPKDVGLNQLKAQMGADSDLLNFPDGNPLPDSVQVTFDDLSKYDATVTKIEAIQGVAKVSGYSQVAKLISTVRSTLETAGIWVCALLVIISLVIIANTVRITMNNRKKEISIMKAVGATNGFIRLPFLVEGVVIGIIAGVITAGLVYVAYTTAMPSLANVLHFTPVPFRSLVGTIAIMFLALGVGAGLIGSVFSISKYLRREGSEFSAL